VVMDAILSLWRTGRAVGFDAASRQFGFSR
jgi:hypothetical protein